MLVLKSAVRHTHFPRAAYHEAGHAAAVIVSQGAYWLRGISMRPRVGEVPERHRHSSAHLTIDPPFKPLDLLTWLRDYLRYERDGEAHTQHCRQPTAHGKVSCAACFPIERPTVFRGGAAQKMRVSKDCFTRTRDAGRECRYSMAYGDADAPAASLRPLPRHHPL